MPENITVDSVLTMAKEAAESGTTEWNRVWLRGRAAEAIHRLRRDAVFGDYVAEAVHRVRQQPYRWGGVTYEEQRLRHEDAKRLFLSGDIEGAKKLLGPVVWSFDVGIRINDYNINFFFLGWELESGNLPAALHRFRTTDWKDSEPQMAVQVARAYILAGRQSEILDLLSKINDRFHYAVERGLLADGAAIRNVVNQGDVMAAVNVALRVQSPGKRVMALAIIAEALAGIPGLPDEQLRTSLGDSVGEPYP
ncbi:MAG TPA: hypothetical protein VKC66_21250 [Xanthobacteraceae bacterium]|nr:hypothetical protein [Xanthobacteraceae bacterium]